MDVKGHLENMANFECRENDVKSLYIQNQVSNLINFHYLGLTFSCNH